MRRFLEFGPSAAFYLFALAAQVSGYISPTVAMILAVIATLLLFVPACHHSYSWHKARKGSGRRGLDSWYFIAPCLLLALLAVAGAAYGIGLRSKNAGDTSVEDKGNQDSVKVQYTKNQIIASHDIYGTDPQLVTYVADSISMGDRLRVFVDYSMHIPHAMGFAGWIGKTRIEIAHFDNYVRGQKMIVPVLSRYAEGENKNLMRWGANGDTPPDNQHKFALADTYRARLVLMGTDGKEQRHYFMIVRGANSNGDIIPYVIADEQLSFRDEWEKEDAKN